MWVPKTSEPEKLRLQKKFQSQKFWVMNNFDSRKLFGFLKILTPELWSQEILGPEKFWVLKNVMKRFWSKKCSFCVSTVLGHKDFTPRKILRPKNYEAWKFLFTEKGWVLKKCWSRKILGPKNFGLQTILSPGTTQPPSLYHQFQVM